MIFPLCKWHFDINWHQFEKKKGPDVFQIYPNTIHLNPLQFCPSTRLLGFPVFCLSFPIVLNSYFHILVNSMTIWSVLKLPVGSPRASFCLFGCHYSYFVCLLGRGRFVFGFRLAAFSGLLSLLISKFLYVPFANKHSLLYLKGKRIEETKIPVMIWVVMGCDATIFRL